MEKRREADILRAIMAYLSARGYVCWRQNSGMVKAGKYAVHSGRKGLPDIGSFMIDGTGRALHIEVKRPGELPSLDQSVMMADMRHWGVVAFCAHSIDEVAAELERAIKR